MLNTKLCLYSRVANMYREKLASLAQKAQKQNGTQVFHPLHFPFCLPKELWFKIIGTVNFNKGNVKAQKQIDAGIPKTSSTFSRTKHNVSLFDGH